MRCARSSSANQASASRSLRPAAIPHPSLPIVSGPARIACARRGHYARRSRVSLRARGAWTFPGAPPKEDAMTVTVDPPKHPLPELTTFELRDYRRQLEQAIAFFDRQDPVPPARDRLQTTLDSVLAEQDARAR